MLCLEGADARAGHDDGPEDARVVLSWLAAVMESVARGVMRGGAGLVVKIVPWGSSPCCWLAGVDCCLRMNCSLSSLALASLASLSLMALWRWVGGVACMGGEIGVLLACVDTLVP